MVDELMCDIHRKNVEISQLQENIRRMERVLGEMTKTASATGDATEDTCVLAEPNTHHEGAAVNGETTVISMDVRQLTESVFENHCTDDGKDRCDKAEANSKPETFPLLERDTVSSAKKTFRQASTDSGVSRGRSFERSKDHDSSLGDSGLQRSMAETELVGILTDWEQLLVENRGLRRQLAELTAAPSSKMTDEDAEADGDVEDSGTTAALQRYATQLESEIAALKQTVKEESVYLVSPARNPDDDGSDSIPWAHPYDCSNLLTDMDEEDVEKQNDDKVGSDVLRSQNALLKQKLKAMKLRWNEYEAFVDKMRNQQQEEATRLHDQQTSLLSELAVKKKQIENFENLSQHQHQRTVDEVTLSYWSALDEVDSRRTRLDDDSGFESCYPSDERTTQGFVRRLESWLNDYETLIGWRNAQRLNGDVNSEHKSEDRDAVCLRVHLEHTQVTADASMTNLEQLGAEVKEEEREPKASDEETDRLQVETSMDQTQLTTDAFATNLNQLETELKAKQEELQRKDEEIDRIRDENEALWIAASSQSPLLGGDHEEQLVAEIERLTFDRSLLQQRLQEAQYEAEETHRELTGENDQLCRELNDLRQRAEDDKVAALKNAELLAAENWRLCDELSQRGVDFRTAEESHRTQLEESAERLREMEEKLMAENGRLHSELVVVTAERSQLRDRCTKLDSDCVAFQELSNEMLERCERLCIELDRFKRSGHSSSTAHTDHEDCRRSAEQAEHEVQALKDENSRLTMILEMERLKNFADERPTMRDSQTDTGDLELPGVSLPASSMDSERRQPKQGVRSHARSHGDDCTADESISSLLLRHAQTARAAALQLRHLLNVEEAQVPIAVEDEQVPGAAVSTYQLAAVIDELVVELDTLQNSEGTTNGLTDGRTDENNYIELTPDNNNQLHQSCSSYCR